MLIKIEENTKYEDTIGDAFYYQITDNGENKIKDLKTPFLKKYKDVISFILAVLIITVSIIIFFLGKKL